MNKIRRAGLVGLALVITSGCISEEREQEIGEVMAAEVNPHLPIIDDPLLNAYVYAVGNRLGEVSRRPDLDYRFYIVNTDAVNAFALPGGHIYLTRGLIERTESGDEFAGVLAHEIGHVAARHGVQRLQRELRTGSLVNVLYHAILGGEPALLRENSLQMANVVWAARHSRQDEKEADRLAIEYLNQTGADPRGVVTLLQTLHEEERREGNGMPVDWFSTHPFTANRIEDAERRIDRLEPSAPPAEEIDLEAFPAFRSLVAQWGFLQQEQLGS